MKKPDEWNPNHPVTREMRDQWHKIAAILMLKFGKDDVEITTADIEQLANSNKANIVCRPSGGKAGWASVLRIQLVSDEEARRLSKLAGGEPV